MGHAPTHVYTHVYAHVIRMSTNTCEALYSGSTCGSVIKKNASEWGVGGGAMQQMYTGLAFAS